MHLPPRYLVESRSPGVRTRGFTRTNGHSSGPCGRYGGRRTHVRDGHTDNVPKSMECPHLHIASTCRAPRWQRRPRARVKEHHWAVINSLRPLRGRRTYVRDAHTVIVPKSVQLPAFAHCTHRPRARVTAASARASLAAPIWACGELAAATGAAAPMCALRTTIVCRKVSNCPHFQVAPTGRARRRQRRPHARVQRDRQVLVKRLQPERVLPYSCERCAHRYSAEMCRNGRICTWHAPAARACDSGVRTRGLSRTDLGSPTACSRNGGRRTHVRVAHNDSMPKNVTLSAFPNGTDRPRAPVPAAFPRAGAAGPMGTFRQLAVQGCEFVIIMLCFDPNFRRQ